ncbi:MAG: hypothetical protein ABSG54_13505 [Terriglobia bacterium]|jgi:hypothetical protein
MNLIGDQISYLIVLYLMVGVVFLTSAAVFLTEQSAKLLAATARKFVARVSHHSLRRPMTEADRSFVKPRN